jgi:DNA mismatch endonuclease (patch repair protein)
MPDVFTKAKRSDVMSRIRSQGNRATELALVRVFRAHGITGWRRHKKLRVEGLRVERRKNSQPSTFNSQLTVRPDFVFPKLRLAVFVDGCFWHGCPLHKTKPRTNAAFWRKKFAANQARDRLVTRTLRSAKWRVLRLWEHELASQREARLLRRLRRALAGAPISRSAGL